MPKPTSQFRKLISIFWSSAISPGKGLTHDVVEQLVDGLPVEEVPAQFEHARFGAVAPEYRVLAREWGRVDGGFLGQLALLLAQLGDVREQVGQLALVGDDRPLDWGREALLLERLGRVRVHDALDEGEEATAEVLRRVVGELGGHVLDRVVEDAPARVVDVVDDLVRLGPVHEEGLFDGGEVAHEVDAAHVVAGHVRNRQQTHGPLSPAVSPRATCSGPPTGPF